MRGSGLAEALATFLLCCPRARGGGRPGTCVPGPRGPPPQGRREGAPPLGTSGPPCTASPGNRLAGPLPGMQLQPDPEAECGSGSLTPAAPGRDALSTSVKSGERGPPRSPASPGPVGSGALVASGGPQTCPHLQASVAALGSWWSRRGATSRGGPQFPGIGPRLFYYFFLANFPPRDPESFSRGCFFSLSEDFDMEPTENIRVNF